MTPEDLQRYGVLYARLEPHVLPTARMLARRFAPALGLSVEDAIQEARLALWKGFQSYDYNRSNGGLVRFARRVVTNEFLALLNQAAARVRNPHTVYTDEFGEQRIARHRFASLSDLEDDVTRASEPDPEQFYIEKQMFARAAALRMRLLKRLGRRDRLVYRCKLNPTEDFLLFLRNTGADEPTNAAIGRYLGLSKNSVDWSIHVIRGEFVKVLESGEFSELLAPVVSEGGWPMLHSSLKAEDVEFVRGILDERGLDPRPVAGARDIALSRNGARVIERYHWGVVVHLKWKGEERTIVAEGRFNPLSGEVIGEHGAWKSIRDVAPWYRQLAAELKR